MHSRLPLEFAAQPSSVVEGDDRHVELPLVEPLHELNELSLGPARIEGANEEEDANHSLRNTYWWQPWPRPTVVRRCNVNPSSLYRSKLWSGRAASYGCPPSQSRMS